MYIYVHPNENNNFWEIISYGLYQKKSSLSQKPLILEKLKHQADMPNEGLKEDISSLVVPLFVQLVYQSVFRFIIPARPNMLVASPARQKASARRQQDDE